MSRGLAASIETASNRLTPARDREPPLDDADNAAIPFALIPPPPGRAERRAARWRNVAAGIWGVYLLALFILPDGWLLQPSLAAVDVLLWPLVRGAGKPAAVVIIAASLAGLTMLAQRFLTDNARLREAKRRAATLNRAARALPDRSPRRVAMERLAAPVAWRLTGAAFVPLGLLLGPLVLTFLWFPARVDPAARNPPPGTTFRVVATVQSDPRTPVTLEVGPPLALDESNPPMRTVEPIRETLLALLARKRAPATLPAGLPPELTAVVERERAGDAADLAAYLDAGLPPQGLTWTVRSSPAAGGRFPVIAHAGDGRPLRLDVVLGDAHPPAPAEVRGRAGERLISLRAVPAKSERRSAFWTPFQRWTPIDGSPPSRLNRLRASVAGWDAGWLGVYLLAYLPAMYLCRRLLGVA